MDYNGELLRDLDPEQRAVATSLHGPMCVLAGAGTGKTRAITYRIAHGVHSGVYDPRNVLAVTFTSRAAGEMRARLRDLGVPDVEAQTFHAAALYQLRFFWPNAIGGRLPEIKEHKLPFVSQAAAQLGMPTDRGSLKDLTEEIEWSKVSLIAPQDYAARAVEQGRINIADQSPEDIARLISAYEEVKQERNIIDFEDAILILIGIMRDRGDITSRIRNRFRHFVVDEYQDVSPMQHRLLQLWLGDRKDLCVVGDVSQTIYSFTGARSSYLSEFSKEFPQATTVKLNRNYRSTPQIVELANSTISHDQLAGAVYLNSMLPSGRPVEFSTYADDADEAAQIAGKILTLRSEGKDLSDIAVLYRTNAQSAQIENALSQAGISYALKGSERFFNRREVREAMVALRAAARVTERSALPEIVESTLKAMGWRPTAPEQMGSARERWESLRALLNLAEEMWDARKATVRDFVLELEERSQLQNVPTVNSVTLSSLHAAKGLEWPIVFLIGMSEGLMPISLANSAEKIREERRLLYVGLTRAQEELHISYAHGNGNRGKRKISRFLDEEWPQPLSLSTQKRKQAKLSHENFAHEHPDDVPLLEELKQWRQMVSEEVGKPAFVILHDATLMQIAVCKPRSLEELGKIKGIGNTKLMKYGLAILSIVDPESARRRDRY
ncbi:ATP-dependent DNA helicase UvrD2 [Arcanobacterium bovis]|uniref:DNA 3'-5' helicase n=1 Tax=Arcanobacterium bovis TaxID=2529275 RepID=A0A4Q9UZX3_9ACTO|nr:ATP-dependent DNA helicase UvrD2 [Arcanobacterium bovis]TBW21595.1 ATP-dependent DNA helicase UvrD2 [Arcanobacterium bovis]